MLSLCNKTNKTMKYSNTYTICKFTNKEISAPLHLAFIWKGDKIVREYRFFDPTTLYAEVAASQKK